VETFTVVVCEDEDKLDNTCLGKEGATWGQAGGGFVSAKVVSAVSCPFLRYVAIVQDLVMCCGPYHRVWLYVMGRSEGFD
jgi:hypothetical protein